MSYLILGTDSLLGSRLYRSLNSQGYSCYISSRRNITKNSFYFDLLSSDFDRLPKGPGKAFIFLGVTDIKKINMNQSMSFFINVNRILKLINHLDRLDWDIIYISSDAAFLLDENADKNKFNFYINYSLQKKEVENCILDIYDENVKIVRLSKVLLENLDFISEIIQKNKCKLRKNHFVSLVSIDYVIKKLEFIAQTKSRLNFIGGETYISYFELFKNFIDKKLINEIKFDLISGHPNEVFNYIDINSISYLKKYQEKNEDLYKFIQTQRKLNLEEN